jgi:uncharacterized protein
MRQKTSSLLIAMFVICFSCSNVSKQKDEVSFVFDQEHLLSETQIKQFDNLFREHKKRTNNEIVMVTTPDYGEDENMLQYATNFGQKHGIGKKELDNGVVIVFSMAKRETRIATGYGTEKILTDEIAKGIIDSLMIPQFRQGKMVEGLWAGSKAIVDFLDKPENKVTNNGKNNK